MTFDGMNVSLVAAAASAKVVFIFMRLSGVYASCCERIPHVPEVACKFKVPHVKRPFSLLTRAAVKPRLCRPLDETLTLATVSYDQCYDPTRPGMNVPRSAVLVRENKAGANSLAAVRPASRGQSCRRGAALTDGLCRLALIPPEMIGRNWIHRIPHDWDGLAAFPRRR